MSYLFERWLITLASQVYSLHKSMITKNVQLLKRDAACYEAELQSLYSYAEQHQIPLLPYYGVFTEIEGQLRLIYEHLRERQTLAEEDLM